MFQGQALDVVAQETLQVLVVLFQNRFAFFAIEVKLCQRTFENFERPIVVLFHHKGQPHQIKGLRRVSTEAFGESLQVADYFVN